MAWHESQDSSLHSAFVCDRRKQLSHTRDLHILEKMCVSQVIKLIHPSNVPILLSRRFVGATVQPHLLRRPSSRLSVCNFAINRLSWTSLLQNQIRSPSIYLPTEKRRPRVTPTISTGLVWSTSTCCVLSINNIICIDSNDVYHTTSWVSKVPGFTI